MRMTLRDLALLALLSLLWGGSFFFAAVAVREVPPLTVVLCRVGIAAAALLLVLRARGATVPIGGTVVVTFLVMGLLNNFVPFSLFFWAQTSIPSGLAAILNATTPIFSMIVAHLLLTDERMSARKVVGGTLGLLGVVLLVGSDAWSGLSLSTFAMLACLGAALSYGFAAVYGRRFRQLEIPPSVGAFGQLAGSTVMMAPVALLVDRPWTLPLPSTAALASIVALALASTALAYVIYFRLLATAGAVNASLVTLLIPVSAILLGAIVLGERLALRHYGGLALIMVGLLAIDGRLAAAIRGWFGPGRPAPR